MGATSRTSTERTRAGYGDVSPNNCWLANTVITIQSVYALLLNAVVLGIVFARVSRPGQRVGISQAYRLTA